MSSPNDAAGAPAPLTIEEQGGFALGGNVITNPGTFDPRNPSDPAGQTLHADHARVFYQVPVNKRQLPLFFWHGYGVAGSTWESTPDGRESYSTIFLRRRFSVYVLDQPRRGHAAKTSVSATISTTPNEQLFFNHFLQCPR
jgi:hypothetical protein